MLRILGSIISLVGSGQRSIVPATNGSQRVGGCNPVLTCSPTVTCSRKTESKVTVICSSKSKLKVAKKFKRKSSIPIQICFSKNDIIQIHQYIEMSQDLNPSTCWSLVIFMYWECENNTFNATPTEWLQQHTLLFAISSTYRTFLLWRLHLAPPSYPGQSTTWLWLDRPSRKCTKLHTVATNNNSDPRSCSFYFCLFAPHRGVVQRWALDWTWIGLDPDWVNEKEMRHHCCENATFFKFFGPHLDLDFTVKKYFGLWLDMDWVLKKSGLDLDRKIWQSAHLWCSGAGTRGIGVPTPFSCFASKWVWNCFKMARRLDVFPRLFCQHYIPGATFTGFFTLILFVVIRIFSITLNKRLQHLQQDWTRLFEMTDLERHK